jgi:two-component system nitrogen regulation response regulator GlnG
MQPTSNVYTLPEPRAGLEQLIDQHIAQYFATLNGTLPAPGLYERMLAQFERPLLVHTLRATGFNQIKAAEILGINRNTLRKKMRLLAIDSKAVWKQAA